ncbi:MAG: glycosyltransferase [Acidaminococcaceae bacterium]|nr:glycosyltransferase [Acidaminococcaceae bacterium]
MKIMQVIPAFRLAGAEVMCENLCIALKNAGETVIAVSLYSEKTAITDRLEKAGVRIEYLDKKLGFDPSIIFKLVRLFKREKPDVVHTHIYASKYGLIAAVLAGIEKKVHTVHNVAQKEQGNLGKKVNSFMYKHFDVVPVALSQEVRKSISDVYGLCEDSVPTIFNGIDLSKCLTKTNYKVNKIFEILHIGRFMQVKNHEILIRAFADFVKRHPSSKLQLLGEGELFTRMQDLAQTLGVADKVDFLGLQSNVYPYLHDADVFCLPSEYEGVPMTLIEAMGTSLPIIAGNVGGIPDMLANGESALLIEPKINEIEEAMETLYSSEELRAKLGQAACRRSEVFSSEAMAKSYMKVYRC